MQDIESLEKEALEKGMQEMSETFKKKGGEIYSEVPWPLIFAADLNRWKRI